MGKKPKRNAFALGFSLPIASFFRVTETKTLFGLCFGPLLATASDSGKMVVQLIALLLDILDCLQMEILGS